MDSQTTTSTIQTPNYASANSNIINFLKSFFIARINRKTFLAGIFSYHIMYFMVLAFFASWKDPLVDSVYFPIFYSLSYMIFMVFHIRRLHDINRSALWTLIILVPRIVAHIPSVYTLLLVPRLIVDSIFMLFLLFKKGDEFTNKYGEKPKFF